MKAVADFIFMNSRDYFHRRYRLSLVAMVAGWLIGLSVYSFSYFYAQRGMQAASQRAQAIWSSPKGVDPATLPEKDRLALLALIEGRQRPQLVVVQLPKGLGPFVPETDLPDRPIKPRPPEPPVKINPKDFVPDVPDAGSDLVRQFLRVSKDSAAASGASVGVGGTFNTPVASNDKGDFIYYDDASKVWKPARVAEDGKTKLYFNGKHWVPAGSGWGWLVSSDSAHGWSDEPGDDWWFVDPATGEKTDRTLSDVEAEMEWPKLSVALALLFSAPWLWYFLLARLREISDALRAHTRD
jgi:hypothetical protein